MNIGKILTALLHLVLKLVLLALGLFVGSFIIYMTNAENKLIYYVIRPFLNKHYDSQTRDRHI